MTTDRGLRDCPGTEVGERLPRATPEFVAEFNVTLELYIDHTVIQKAVSRATDPGAFKKRYRIRWTE
ncbi:hypothetical protein GCM10009847_10590 [Leucobacter tardus]